jgi:hypothetical protein
MSNSDYRPSKSETQPISEIVSVAVDWRHIERVTTDNLKPMLEEIVEKNAVVMTDSAKVQNSSWSDAQKQTRSSQLTEAEERCTIKPAKLERPFRPGRLKPMYNLQTCGL